MEQPEILLATLTPEMLDSIIAQDKQEAMKVLKACEAITATIPDDTTHLNQVLVDLKVRMTEAALADGETAISQEEIALTAGRVIAVLSFTLQLPAVADHMVVDEITRIAIRTLIVAQEARKSQLAVAEAEAAVDEAKPGVFPEDEAVVH